MSKSVMPSLARRSARDRGNVWIFGSFFDVRKRNQGFILQQKNSWMCILGYSLIFMWFLFCFFLTNKSNVNWDHVFCGISRCWSTEPFAMNQVPRYSSLTFNTSLPIAVNNVVKMTNLMLKMKVIAAHQILLLKFVACLWHNLMFINVQKLSGSPGEMALVVFTSHGPHAGECTTLWILAFWTRVFSLLKYHFCGTFVGCLIQQSGWTSSMDVFFKWLSAISFVGGGFGEAAIAEALAEALMVIVRGPLYCALRFEST